MGLSLESTSRPAGAIIERLIRKLRQDDPQARIDQALSSLERLSGAYGESGPAIAHAASLLHDLQLPTGPLDELTAIVDLVVGAGVDPARLIVDLGLSRGLHYYSGMIFEIEGPDGLQLCGGGRYDDLIGVLQRRPRGAVAPETPAAGFAFGLERVAAQSRRRPAESAPTLLIVAPDAQFKLAMRVAGALRQRGYRVLLDARARTLQANLRDAARRGCSALVALDGAEVDAVETLDETSLHWYDLGSHGETNTVRRIPLSALEVGASIAT
jgi:histidyl-tRNA synthetase